MTAQVDALRARLEASLEENKKMSFEVTRAASVNEIKRLLGKLVTICQSRHKNPDYPKLSEAWTLFADRQDSTLEIEENGVYKGIGHIREWFKAFYEAGPFVGVQFERNLTSPQIVIAGDGMSARGVWEVVGHDTDPRNKENGSSEGNSAVLWNWGTIRADFINIGCEWKIWHYHYYQRMSAPFYRSWADCQKSAAFTGPYRDRPGFAGQNLPGPDAPPTWHNTYSLQTVQVPYPPSPEPYDMWTDEMGQA